MNIKIEFKGKNYLLSKQITTVEKIKANIKQRYQNYFRFGVKLGVVISNSFFQINSDADLQSFKNKNNGTTLKIRAIQMDQNLDYIVPSIKKSQDLNQSSVFEVSKIYSSVNEVIQQEPIQKIEQVPQIIDLKQQKEIQKIQIIQKIEVNPKKSEIQFKKSYKCYRCNGTGEVLKIKKNKIKTCSICQGEKIITENNRIMPFLNELITDKVKQILESMKINIKQQKQQVKLQQIKKENFKEQQQKQWKMENHYDFSFLIDPEKRIQSRRGKKYDWNLLIRNTSEITWPKTCKIFKIQPNNVQQIFQLKPLQPNEFTQINLNFNAFKDNTIELHEFRIGYTNELKQKKFFGPKFGYELDTKYKKIEQPELKQSVLMERIKRTCLASKKRKQYNYNELYKFVKELGFDQKIPNELLEQIIENNN